MLKKSKKCVISCFKRWARTNWAAFASMHKQVKIGVLTLSMSLLTLSFEPVLAQVEKSDTLKHFELKEAKVITQKSNPTRGMISPVEVYNRNKMKTSPITTFEDVLKINPAVDLRQRGAQAIQADISLYGGTADQTMIMLNGINFTDARTGHQSHSLPIDIEGISSIHLIGGVPGIGAFTGAINISTSPLKPNYIKTSFTTGQYGYKYVNLSSAISNENISAMIIGSVRNSDGYTDNTDYNNSNLFSRITAKTNLGRLDFQIGYQDRFFGANGFYSLLYPNQSEKTSTYLTSLKWSKIFHKNIKLNSFISYRKNLDRFELFRDNEGAASWYSGHNYHMTDNYGIGINMLYSWPYGITGIGLDYTYNHIYSTVLGNDLASPKTISGENGKYYTKEAERHIINGWLKHQIKLGKFNLKGSLNIAHSSYGNSTMWSLGTDYYITNALSVGASTSRSMRLPTFTDLYYITRTHTGNANLTPEKATTYRLSSTYNFLGSPDNNIKLFGSVYYRKGEDIIDWIKPHDEDKWLSSQITNINTFGAECMASYSSLKFLRELILSYGYLNSDKDANKYISKYALDYLKHKFAVQTCIEPIKDLKLNIIGSWNDRTSEFVNTAGELESYKPYWMFNARLSYTLDNHYSKTSKVNNFKTEIYLDIQNIFDIQYYDFGGLIQLGRWISVGISFCLF
ncbi:MAG: TonB-dependent receptor [Bacteroidales bacterium]